MQTQFYVSHDGNNVGPHSADEIVSKIAEGHIHLTDYVYDEGKQDWTLLMEFGPISDKLKSKKPKAPPKMKVLEKPQGAKGSNPVEHQMETLGAHKPVEVKSEEGDEWFVLKWDNRYGPFSYTEMLKMLQEKTVFEFDFTWKKGMETWVRIAELTPFAHDEVKKAADSGKTQTGEAVSEAFFRRRHMRTEFNGSIVIHDGKKVWKGKSLEISEGGAGVVMYNAMVVPGQKLYVHFKPGDSVPPFNAVVEVVSKKYQKGLREADAAVGYGVKFLEINKGAQKAIQEYVASKAA